MVEKEEKVERAFEKAFWHLSQFGGWIEKKIIYIYTRTLY